MLNIEFQSPDAAKTTTLQTPTPLGMTSDPVSFTLPSSHFFSHDTPSEPPQYKAKQQANVVPSLSPFFSISFDDAVASLGPLATSPSLALISSYY